jgi:acetyl esterase/lipase
MAIVVGVLALPAAATATSPPIYRGLSYGPSVNEIATVFESARPASPVVVLVHGGGWRTQTMETEQGADAKSLQLKGFTVVDVNYDQDSPAQAAFPTEVLDVEEATRWAISHAASYDGEPGNVILLGGSAGGQLAAMAGEALDAATPGAVRGIVSLSGPMNFQVIVAMAENKEITDKSFITSVEQALGCPGNLGACSPAFEAEWSPALSIPASGCPAWLLLSSEVDTTESRQASEMLARLRGAGCTATWRQVPTGHGFSMWPRVFPAIVEFVRAT